MLNPRRTWPIVAAAVILAAAVITVVLLPDLAWTRAGGGQDFGGGDWGSGDDGGIGIIIGLLVWLAIEHPVIGVPLLIIAVIVFFVFGRKAKSAHTTSTIKRATTIARQADAAAALQALPALSQRDPGFSKEAFLARAGQAFLRIQEAWSAQDLSKARAFISDGVRERFELQFEMQKARGVRNNLGDVVILGADVAAAASDRHFDTLHVRFVARMRDEDVDLKTGKVLRLNTAEAFTEVWTFLRRPGAKTLEKGGLVEGTCPNCGAELQISDAGQCAFCHAVVTSGEYDWVLVEITQESEWSPAPPAAVPGLDQMGGTDPAFNLAHIEDRASVMFWRVQKAMFAGNAAPLGSVALPEFMQRFAPGLAPAQDGTWPWVEEPAVGAIEVRAIVPGGGGDSRDRIDVLVTWSGIDARRSASGASSRTGTKAIRLHVYALVRQSSVRTPEKAGFRSAPCPGCGAPDDGTSTKGACSFCGTPVTDGGRDWVLASIETATAAMLGAPAVQAAFHAPAQARADLLLAGMASAMFADGVVDPKEAEMLQQLAASRGVPPQQVQSIIAAVQGNVPLPRPSTPQESRELLEAMARMALADGKVTKEEEERLVYFGAPLGLAKADVVNLIARQRSVMYREAKSAIREARRRPAPP
jgi:uncharacterized tellurite resistance protein B-like protein